MNITNWRKGAILFSVLLFPSLIYVILSSGDHSFTSRPYYGPKEVSEFGDTIYYKINPFNVSSCTGGVINSAELTEKLFIISFSDVSDSITSARINSQLMTMQDRFRDNSDVVIFSLGTKTDSLSIEKLCELESGYPTREGKWVFGTLVNDLPENWAIANLQVESFKQNLVVLVDKRGHIRSMRDGSQYVEIKKLAEDVKVLKAEEFIPKKKKEDEEK